MQKNHLFYPQFKKIDNHEAQNSTVMEIFEPESSKLESNREVLSNLTEILEGRRSKPSDDFKGGTFLCETCKEKQPLSLIVYVIGCDHSVCLDCISELVALNLKNNMCGGIKVGKELKPQVCDKKFKCKKFYEWIDELSEGYVLNSGRINCPYKYCSTLIKDSDVRRVAVLVQLKCPDCRRFFCVNCKVPWHMGESCGTYQNRNNGNVGERSQEFKFEGETSNSNNVKERSQEFKFEGESSNSKSNVIDEQIFLCDICAYEKPMSASFLIRGCNHSSYCSDCVAKYVDTNLQENVSEIKCPNIGCEVKLDPRDCTSILSLEVFNRWCDALCEALILSTERFYCPFKDCSVLLINDSDARMQSECPNCHRLFCAQCNVPWHSEVCCEEYMKLDKGERESGDIMLMKLAKEKEWKRCPNCKFYVQRSSGCLFMTCRCKCTFCYNCGAAMDEHYCKNCKH